MRKRARITPFERCIPSTVDSPQWGTDKKAVGKWIKTPYRRFVHWIITLAVTVLLALGFMRIYSPSLDLNSEDIKWQTQPEERTTTPWNQEGNDLGMVLLDIPTRQAAVVFHVPSPGVYVLAVVKLSPAFRGGVKPGDHIVGLDGAPVDGAAELTEAFYVLKDGDTVELTIRRGLERLTLMLEMEAGEQL